MNDTETNGANCPRRMAREDFARNVLNRNAPVFAEIEAHLSACETCRNDDVVFRSAESKKKGGGFLSRIFGR